LNVGACEKSLPALFTDVNARACGDKGALRITRVKRVAKEAQQYVKNDFIIHFLEREENYA